MLHLKFFVYDTSDNLIRYFYLGSTHTRLDVQYIEYLVACHTGGCLCVCVNMCLSMIHYCFHSITLHIASTVQFIYLILRILEKLTSY